MTRLPIPGSKSERIAKKRIDFRRIILGEDQLTVQAMRSVWKARRECRRQGREKAARKNRARAERVRLRVWLAAHRCKHKYRHSTLRTFSEVLKNTFTPDRVDALSRLPTSPLWEMVQSQ